MLEQHQRYHRCCEGIVELVTFEVYTDMQSGHGHENDWRHIEYEWKALKSREKNVEKNDLELECWSVRPLVLLLYC
jgi:hypothetical protein